MTGRLLHLLRHGALETPGLLMGRTDGVPTREGIAACAARAARLDIDAIVSSDMLRTRRAAEMIGPQRGVAIRIDPRWRELDFGAWDGLAPSVIDQDAFARFHDAPDGCAPPGGERWSALVERVAHAIAALDSPSTLVVTHGGAMRAALAHLCGFSQSQLWAFDLPYAALLSLRIWQTPKPYAQIIGLAT